MGSSEHKLVWQEGLAFTELIRSERTESALKKFPMFNNDVMSMISF